MVKISQPDPDNLPEPPEGTEWVYFHCLETPQELYNLDLAAWYLNEQVTGYDFYVLHNADTLKDGTIGHFAILAAIDQETRDQREVGTAEQTICIAKAVSPAAVRKGVESLIRTVEGWKEGE